MKTLGRKLPSNIIFDWVHLFFVALQIVYRGADSNLSYVQDLCVEVDTQ